jgi:hypothetical protein
MGIFRLLEPFSKEISHMSKYNEDKVRDVCGDKEEIRRLVHDWICDGSVRGMPADTSMR